MSITTETRAEPKTGFYLYDLTNLFNMYTENLRNIKDNMREIMETNTPQDITKENVQKVKNFAEDAEETVYELLDIINQLKNNKFNLNL